MPIPNPYQLLQLIYQRKSNPFPVKSFNSVLNVIINEGLYHRGLEFYDYVVNSNMKMNISPNGFSFNLVIKALCKLGFVDRAIEVLGAMPEKKCLPDGYTYCTLMDGLCKEERIDEAVCGFDRWIWFDHDRP